MLYGTLFVNIGITMGSYLIGTERTLATKTYMHLFSLTELRSRKLTFTRLNCVRINVSLVHVLMLRQIGSPQTYTYTSEFVSESKSQTVHD